jgi:hypothetical protein
MARIITAIATATAMATGEKKKKPKKKKEKDIDSEVRSGDPQQYLNSKDLPKSRYEMT